MSDDIPRDRFFDVAFYPLTRVVLTVRRDLFVEALREFEIHGVLSLFEILVIVNVRLSPERGLVV